MSNEPITVEDYKVVADEFFSKYNFVVERLGPGPTKAEDVRKVMEATKYHTCRKTVSILLKRSSGWVKPKS